VEGKVESAPPKHLRSALGQIVNFFYTLQGEAAGAQAISSFDKFSPQDWPQADETSKTTNQLPAIDIQKAILLSHHLEIHSPMSFIISLKAYGKFHS